MLHTSNNNAVEFFCTFTAGVGTLRAQQKEKVAFFTWLWEGNYIVVRAVLVDRLPISILFSRLKRSRCELNVFYLDRPRVFRIQALNSMVPSKKAAFLVLNYFRVSVERGNSARPAFIYVCDLIWDWRVLNWEPHFYCSPSIFPVSSNVRKT